VPSAPVAAATPAVKDPVAAAMTSGVATPTVQRTAKPTSIVATSNATTERTASRQADRSVIGPLFAGSAARELFAVRCEFHVAVEFV
jgi:hypothetical protein